MILKFILNVIKFRRNFTFLKIYISSSCGSYSRYHFGINDNIAVEFKRSEELIDKIKELKCIDEDLLPKVIEIVNILMEAYFFLASPYKIHKFD